MLMVFRPYDLSKRKKGELEKEHGPPKVKFRVSRPEHIEDAEDVGDAEVVGDLEDEERPKKVKFKAK